MTWMKTIPSSEADEKLRAAYRWRSAYPPEYGASVPALAEICKDPGSGISDSHSLIPDALYHSFAGLGAMLQPDLPLERRQHEMSATLVSVLNECFY